MHATIKDKLSQNIYPNNFLPEFKQITKVCFKTIGYQL